MGRTIFEEKRFLKPLRATGWPTWGAEVPDPKIMADENHLSSVDFEVREIDQVASYLPLLGDLRNLIVLKTIRIIVHRPWEAGDIDLGYRVRVWDKLDSLLMSLARDVEVEIYSAFDSRTQRMDAHDVLKKLLPLLSERGTLNVYSNALYEGNALNLG